MFEEIIRAVLLRRMHIMLEKTPGFLIAPKKCHHFIFTFKNYFYLINHNKIISWLAQHQACLMLLMNLNARPN